MNSKGGILCIPVNFYNQRERLALLARSFSTNSDKKEMGNIVINNNYGFFIRENIYGKLDRNNKYIKTSDGFSNLSKLGGFNKDRKGFLGYRDCFYFSLKGKEDMMF